jgi:hypothetical protein
MTRSDDGGATWSDWATVASSTEPRYERRLYCDGEGRLTLIVRGSGMVEVLSSRDRGDSWQMTSFDTDADDNQVSLGYPVSCDDGAGSLYYAYQDYLAGRSPLFVRRSRDFGRTWGDAAEVAETQGGYEIACAPGGRVHVALDRRYPSTKMTRSADGGATWQATPLAFPDGRHFPEIEAIAVAGEALHVFWAEGNDSRELFLMSSDDGGASFGASRAIGGGLTIDDVEARADESGRLVVVWRSLYEQGGAFFQASADGGRSWLRERIRLDAPITPAVGVHKPTPLYQLDRGPSGDFFLGWIDLHDGRNRFDAAILRAD